MSGLKKGVFKAVSGVLVASLAGFVITSCGSGSDSSSPRASMLNVIDAIDSQPTIQIDINGTINYELAYQEQNATLLGAGGTYTVRADGSHAFTLDPLGGDFMYIPINVACPVGSDGEGGYISHTLNSNPMFRIINATDSNQTLVIEGYWPPLNADPDDDEASPIVEPCHHPKDTKVKIENGVTYPINLNNGAMVENFSGNAGNSYDIVIFSATEFKVYRVESLLLL